MFVADHILMDHRDWKVLVDEWVNATAAFTGYYLRVSCSLFDFQDQRTILCVSICNSELKFEPIYYLREGTESTPESMKASVVDQEEEGLPSPPLDDLAFFSAQTTSMELGQV